MKEQKKTLRRRVKKSIQSLSDIRKKELSILVQNNIRKYLQEKSFIHKSIGLYYPLPDEVNPIFDESKSFFFPKINSESEMKFYPSSLCDLVQREYLGKIFKEPHQRDREADGSIDIYLVPGLAFTKEGARLGRGKGYYDKYFERIEKSSRDILKIGVCFDEQIFEEDEIQTESHDIRMNTIITPSSVYEANNP